MCANNGLRVRPLGAPREGVRGYVDRGATTGTLHRASFVEFVGGGGAVTFGLQLERGVGD